MRSQELAQSLATELVFHSSTVMWLVGFHTVRARAEVRRFHRALANSSNNVHRTTVFGQRSAASPTSPHTHGGGGRNSSTSRQSSSSSSSSLLPSTNSSSSSSSNNNNNNNNKWQACFAHCRAAVDLLRLATRGAYVRPSDRPPAPVRVLTARSFTTMPIHAMLCNAISSSTCVFGRCCSFQTRHQQHPPSRGDIDALVYS